MFECGSSAPIFNMYMAELVTWSDDEDSLHGALTSSTSEEDVEESGEEADGECDNGSEETSAHQLLDGGIAVSDIAKITGLALRGGPFRREARRAQESENASMPVARTLMLSEGEQRTVYFLKLSASDNHLET